MLALPYGLQSSRRSHIRNNRKSLTSGLMLCHMPYITLHVSHQMVRGFSGRIVLEMDREMKQALYTDLS